jgi:hypothetical protein
MGDLSSSSLNQTGSEHTLSEEEFRAPTLPGPPPSLSRAGRNIVGNFFTRIDRSGRIVKTKWDIERERKGLVQLDLETLTFENLDSVELNRRNIKEAVDNVRAEEEESKTARTSQKFQ